METFKYNFDILKPFCQKLIPFFQDEYIEEAINSFKILKSKFGKTLKRQSKENGVFKSLHKSKYYPLYLTFKPIFEIGENNEVDLNREKLETESKYYATRKTKIWCLKIAEKLHKAKILIYDYEKVKIENTDYNCFKGNKRAIVIHSTFYEHKILLVQGTIKNRSSNNTRFSQHKCFLFLNGKRISEKELHLFMDLYEDINNK